MLHYLLKLFNENTFRAFTMRHPKGIAGLHFPKLRLRTCVGIRQKLKEGYAFSDLKSDLMAGIVVSMVAIPLGMALAIASGVAPQFGLYTVIVAGFITALLGGSRFNVTGPTAAFVVVLVPIAQNFGLAGLLLAGAMAGVMLVILGITGLGQAIKLIPHPVTTGFTAGISVVIATIQLKDFFGLTYEGSPQHYIDRIGMVIKNASTASLSETSIALCTLAILILWPKINKKIPSPLVALSIVTIATIALQNIFPEFQIATINNRFLTTIDGIVVYGIPQALPQFAFPWTFPGAVGKSFTFDFQTIQTLIPSAIAIAMLGAIESLLCAVVADGMTQTKHDPNAELTALGVANMICPFFGGIAATGAIARTATNIRFGARSPLAAIIHSIITMLIVLLFANYVSYLPMAALSALLMLVAYNMSEIKNFGHIVKAAPRSDVVVLLTCFSLTVLFDMVIGVTFGVLMAA